MDFEVDSEVAQALFGFLHDGDPFIDTLFQNDVSEYIQEQLPPLVESNALLTTASYIVPSLSTQTVAARKRRKRISEKTQELARLIPDGTNMNTADMLESAHKYVKFLQAEVAVLQLMTSTSERRSPKEEECLQVLLASQAIQKRLAAKGMCLLPSSVTP